MDNKQNRIYVTVYLTCTFLLFFTMVGSKLTSTYVIAVVNAASSSANITGVNWEERFPYDTVVELVDSGVERKEVSVVTQIKNEIFKFSTLGTDCSKAFIYYDEVARLGYVFSSFLKDPSIGVSYIKTRDGYWVNGEPERIDLNSAKESVVSYASLQKYLEGEDIDFLYFYIPLKMCSVDPQLPDGVSVYTNENIDTHLEAMDYFGIKYVDFRENIHGEGLNHHAMFYKTDHHWTVETGLWASREMAREMNETYGYALDDTYDVDQYELKTYPKAAFGSEGWGVTHFVAESEDFTIPFPKFETNYRLEIPNKGVDATGTFAELFIDYEKLDLIMKEGGCGAYEQILCGNTPYTKITNLNHPEGIKVLMLKDSFAIAVAPYLAELCSELVMLDVRSDNGNFTGSIISCINEFEPDIVLTCQFRPHVIKLNQLD